ncbi:4a-hydroxytetrahydrobiopterin dehydratase [Ruania alkalisoli]|uniref:Putative pterin-4-alpha-carbinolamine dehydratase n=1 Tax=Ruania alkalisoli TaxID=2779775 RepID=A0A7M1SR17_9MICO|nr:4a-hydroxytetrahydrobiopterin dehydratase [Ruania alkalisoli]QOR69577.1 4a-hydroxytetrahydrobiopterin dehydratase [Ruania alkalisoli]
MRTLSAEQVAAHDGLEDWRVVKTTLQTSYATGSFAAGARLVGRISQIADELNHHPDVTVRYPSVLVTTTSHDVGGLTERDITLARRISELARSEGVSADPSVCSALEIAIDVLDRDAVLPFWRAVLGYGNDPNATDRLGDPGGRHPEVWFQQMDAPRPQRNRIHIDVCVPQDVAEARIQAALEAGGVLLSDSRAPAFWVLADPEGNEACVCTSFGRERPA